MQLRWLKRLFKRDANEDFKLEPKYGIGELVVLYNPYVLDGMVADEIESPRVAVITKCVYVANMGVFAYQLDGEPKWYNEAWLFPAVHGAETLSVELVDEISVSDRIDTLLDEYNDYKTLMIMFGDNSYKRKMRELETKMSKLISSYKAY